MKFSPLTQEQANTLNKIQRLVDLNRLKDWRLEIKENDPIQGVLFGLNMGSYSWQWFNLNELGSFYCKEIYSQANGKSQRGVKAMINAAIKLEDKLEALPEQNYVDLYFATEKIGEFDSVNEARRFAQTLNKAGTFTAVQVKGIQGKTVFEVDAQGATHEAA